MCSSVAVMVDPLIVMQQLKGDAMDCQEEKKNTFSFAVATRPHGRYVASARPPLSISSASIAKRKRFRSAPAVLSMLIAYFGEHV